MYRCPNCGYESKAYFGICPRCKDATGELVEGVAPSKKGEAFRNVTKRAERIKLYDEVYVTSGWTELDAVISEKGGFVEGQVISLGAAPGTGKSTLTCQLGKFMKVLYISSEETHNQVSKRAIRLKVPEENLLILSTTEWDNIINAVTSEEYDLVVVDSIQAIEGSFLAYSKAIQYTSELTNMIKSRGKFGILINQVTKGGDITGHNSIQHITDTVLSMEAVGDQILLSSIKNRFGTIGEIMLLEHGAEGLETSSFLIDDQLPAGAVIIYELFGKNKRPVTIESLVVKSSSVNNPARRATNVNGNKVFSLVALIIKFGLKLNTKDVFVNSSIPLGSSQSIDLAIATSIISSATEKQIQEVEGRLSLTGVVRNGKAKIGGKEITFSNIKQLITLLQ